MLYLAIKGVMQSFKEIGIKKTIEKYCYIIKVELSKKKMYSYVGNTGHRDKYIVGICVSGGIGDAVITMNYVAKLKEILASHAIIKLFFLEKKSIIDYLIDDNDFDNVEQFFFMKKDAQKLDLLISMVTYFPRICYYNTAIEPESELGRYAYKLKKFNDTHQYLVNGSYQNFCKEAAVYLRENHVKRVFAAQIDDDSKKWYDFCYSIPQKSKRKEFNMPERFITIHRGADENNRTKESTKLWPKRYYDQLISLINEKYPQYPIYQIGVTGEEKLKGVNYEYFANTSLSDVTEILKKSMLHIDCEGGLVHIRHFACGKPSIVIFGPTLPQVYGYSENINIRNNKVCINGCTWEKPDWNDRCCRDGMNHECMRELSPLEVFHKIDKEIECLTVS